MYEICSMKILVVSATELEIAPFRVSHPDAEILITGVGIPSTVFHLTKKLMGDKYDMVIQCGIGGTFSNLHKLGSVVLVQHDTFGDIGIEEKGVFTDLFGYGLADPNKFPFENHWLVNHHPIFNSNVLPTVMAVTVNTISDDQRWIEMIRLNTPALTQSMEGAAFHYVCLQLNIPFLQLRGLSNKVGERDKKNWSMHEAIKNSNLELEKLIEHFSQ